MYDRYHRSIIVSGPRADEALFLGCLFISATHAVGGETAWGRESLKQIYIPDITSFSFRFGSASPDRWGGERLDTNKSILCYGKVRRKSGV